MATELSKAGKIRQAAAHLENEGWIQKKFGTGFANEPVAGGPCCVQGALWLATDWDQGQELAKELSQRLGLGGTSFTLWEWNDDEERTAGDVVQTLLDWADAVEESDALT